MFLISAKGISVACFRLTLNATTPVGHIRAWSSRHPSRIRNQQSRARLKSDSSWVAYSTIVIEPWQHFSLAPIEPTAFLLGSSGCSVSGWDSFKVPIYSSTADLTAVCEIIQFDQSVEFAADITQECLSLVKNAIFSVNYPCIDLLHSTVISHI